MKTHTQAQHTPGPFRITEQPSDPLDLLNSTKNGFAVWSDNPHCMVAQFSTREDAELFAAAPDLLSALIEVSAMLDAAQNTGYLADNRPFSEDVSARLVQARNAIARATGAQP